MKFSPEGKMSLDKQSLHDLLGEVIEEKFETFLQPLKEDISTLKRTLKSQTEKHDKEIEELKQKNKLLDEANATLQSQLGRIESFQRKNNLRIDGIKEV